MTRLLTDPLVFIHVVLRLYPLQLQSPLSKINFLFFRRKIMDQIKSNQIKETLLKLDVVTVQCTVTTSNIIRVNSKDILQYFKNLWRALGCSVPCRVSQFRFKKSFASKRNLAKQKQFRFVSLQFCKTTKKSFASFCFVSFASFR